MTDLHCHLLPGIDDGSKDVSMSLELLRIEKRQRVDRIVFTSHYYPDDISLEKYIENRNRAYDTLMSQPFNKSLFQFSLGAEVKFSPILAQQDLRQLTFTGTDYMLMEFDFYNRPAFLEEVFDEIKAQGIIPVIAHVERYEWLSDYTELYDWVKNRGFVIQSNSGALLHDRETRNEILQLMEWNLIHVISTDAHNTTKRTPNLLEGMKVITEYLGEEKATEIMRNGNAVFKGLRPVSDEPYCPKKKRKGWV